ncbi:succinylglutamate desuccinylase/aspartoacylase family protein [Halostagnicola sp. A-GB9-2]|uniref:PKD domain-containing protein n=1 Tax=Halostagnicola sp. A-GB9-2 TaxID=3048066 RepID=UPI0024C0176F|nr:succinylglutamate desuccinylase/aspartoacylase family protein [Halostagnicola sp. A-GB9-2]MDJ1431848.1 succinylglutamate desuccinylase/aspartoacylase family protein [Halostagnicola sp. A-GB9-2]
MLRDTLSRRSTLALVAGSAITGAGIATTSADDEVDGDESVSRDSHVILEGTDHETTVYTTEAQADGPTVLVVGGVHGNEVAGYATANEIAKWAIDAGTLVTIPEANATAVDQQGRAGADGVDLNRQFPESSEPQTELARGLWDVVLENEPDIVIDLHESTGIYAGDPVDGVGQAIFRSNSPDATTTAQDAVDHVNGEYVDESDPLFEIGNFTRSGVEPSGLLVHKATRDLDADAFLVETLSTDHDLETRVEWQSVIVERLVEDALFPEEEPDNGHGSGDDIDEDEESADEDDEFTEDEQTDDDASDSPTAEIETDPAGAKDHSLEPGQTVTLDGTCAETPNEAIEAYEWSVYSADQYNKTGETIDVTIAKDGEYSVGLRVVDETGATGKTKITLSTE